MARDAFHGPEVLLMGKVKLRQELRLRRAAISKASRADFSASAAQNLVSIPELSKTENIGLFASVRDEIDTRPLFEELLYRGKNVFFPRMQKQSQSLSWGRIEAWDALVRGPMGIGQPVEAPNGSSELGLIVVPGLGFGLNGGRLGYGAGWYDRTLELFDGVVVGLGFECQVLDGVPVEEHDHLVDWIVTELRAVSVKE
jgi:5-formyltetrahydrofolate cyclo-ligase